MGAVGEVPTKFCNITEISDRQGLVAIGLWHILNQQCGQQYNKICSSLYYW